MDKIKAFFSLTIAWIKDHKKISIGVGIALGALVIFLAGLIKGCTM